MPVLPALTRRERIPELMDDPGLDPAEHRLAPAPPPPPPPRRGPTPGLMAAPGLDPAEPRLALAGLARVNRISRSAAILRPPIRRLARELSGRPVRILDIATGSGDVPLAL